MSKNILTVYFTQSELINSNSQTIPIISDKCNFSDLSKLVAVSKYRFVLVKTVDGFFNNIVTQGDTLRYSVHGVGNNETIASVIENKRKAIVAINSVQSEKVINNHNFSAIPIVDPKNYLIGVSVQSAVTEVLEAENVKLRIGMVMAGGKGKRLYPLTKDTPKPLLHLGRQSILEHVLDALQYAKFNRYVLMTGHLSEKFLKFQEKTTRELSIFVEDEPLGTGGPFLKWINDDRENIDAYLREYESFTLLVCNGDLIFDISPDMVAEFEASEDQVSLIARYHHLPIKFGVLSTDGDKYLDAFTEKPVYEFLVNTGIYLFRLDKPFLKVLDEIKTMRIDMPDLLTMFDKEYGVRVRVREIAGNYIDVGTKDDLIEVSAFFKE